ncbi:hypothetical protein [Streptomyces camelliae]|uniref:Pilus assembly protein TadE n=1 Tax=Streptomyces camelliae TaxID=3004093 RepID=A0ABY7NYD3_9ACTN|nr:hypothetical protein [Streptomyces sp. HUAS 2-6]WBO62522.1 hypothetical protein O1G22_06660 [Streptomyces sp. HUAS 2-6]
MAVTEVGLAPLMILLALIALTTVGAWDDRAAQASSLVTVARG